MPPTLLKLFLTGVGGQGKTCFLISSKIKLQGFRSFCNNDKLEDNAKEIEEIGNVFIRRITPMGQ